MNSKIRSIVLLTLIMLLIGTATAYEATVAVYYPDDYDDLENASWIMYGTRTIAQGEIENIMDLKIKLVDVEEDTNSALLNIIYDGDVWQSVYIEDTEKFIGDDEDVKIKLTDLSDDGGFSSASTSTDDVVRVWIAPNSAEELGLTKDPLNPPQDSFNPMEYGKTSGWSGSSSNDEVVMYIERLVDTSISYDIEGGEWEEVTNTNDCRKFLLQENAVYVITVEYLKDGPWGYSTEEVEVYRLSITGLAFGTNTVTSGTSLTPTGYQDTIIGTYNEYVNKYVIVSTPLSGTWEVVSHCDIRESGQTSTGDYSWRVKFDTAGTYKVGFMNSDGTSGYYKFIMRAVEPVATVAAEQTQATDDDDDGSSFGVIIGLLGLIGMIIAVSIYSQKKKRNKIGDRVKSEHEITA